MATHIDFQDNSPAVLAAFDTQATQALVKCGIQAVHYATNLAPVDQGALRNSIAYSVVGDYCYFGSNLEYAPYVEMGTGIYYSGGRDTPWVYKDAKGNWHWTRGQEEKPYIKPALENHTDEYLQIIESALSE